MKQNLSNNFTKIDGVKLEKKLLSSIDEKIDFKIVEKLNEIRDEMKQWHSDIFDLVDGLGLEIKTGREFRLITTNQIVDVEKRTGNLEKKVFGQVTTA